MRGCGMVGEVTTEVAGRVEEKERHVFLFSLSVAEKQINQTTAISVLSTRKVSHVGDHR